jgi:nucleobase:cation symporter-1, NCS1 family
MANDLNLNNSALTPVGAAERVFGTRDHAALWLSLGVGLLVMQVGAYLVPSMGTQAAMLAIVVGSAIGSALLAWAAYIGAQRGLSSAGLMTGTFGSGFAKLPIMLNIVQLIGWTAFELVIMRDGIAAMFKQSFGTAPSYLPYVATMVLGGLLVWLARGSMLTLVRQFVGKFALPLVLLSLAWLTYQFVDMAMVKGFAAFWTRPSDGKMSFISAVDLVMAMPISWLPLIADYARYGKSASGAFKGTFAGYMVANVWCYALGVLVVSVAPQGDLVQILLLAQAGLLALGLILIDELDNAYGDVHSGAVSSHSLLGSVGIKQWGMAMAALCTVLAMVLDMHAIEPFLLMLSSIFAPLFGVILARMCAHGAATNSVINVSAVLIWLAGVAVFHLLPKLTPDFGAAIPALLFTLVAAYATRGKP